MSDKSDDSVLTHRVESNVLKAALKPPEKEIVEIKRDEIFSRMDRPLYMEQRVFHIVWMATAHLFAAYYFYLDWVCGQVPRTAVFFELLYGYLGGLGITIGCHRYWTHKTFKATMPLQIILMILQTIATQAPIHKWCLDHRIHHKYTDTDADPHNSKRGFWYSHCGWMFLPKRKEYEQKCKTFDMSDLEKDPVVRFQARWYYSLTLLFHFILPISVFYYLWGMPLLHCIAANYRRYVVSLHVTWCVNSVAHMHICGGKPYDKSISSVEFALLSFFAVGEGQHNYHHAFPMCYRASEFGWKLNVSTMLIDFFASIGWAYDLKTVSQKILKDRLRRTGDQSHVDAIINRKDATAADFAKVMQTEKPLWGWDDSDVSEDLRSVTRILSPKGEH